MHQEITIINTQKVVQHFQLQPDKTDGEITLLNAPIAVFRLRPAAGMPVLISIPMLLASWVLSLGFIILLIVIHFDCKRNEIANGQTLGYLKRRFCRLLLPIADAILLLEPGLRNRRKF